MALGAIILTCAAANIGVTWWRTMIPLELNGVVSRLEILHEKHPGIDDIYLVTVGDRRYHVDQTVGPRLLPGAEIGKRRWSKHLETSDGPVQLKLSRDASSMLVAMPFVAIVGLLLLMYGDRRPGRGNLSSRPHRGHGRDSAPLHG